MENENANTNQCCRCKNYDAYYTLGQKTFNKTKCGMCSEKREVVQMHDTCENFSRKKLFGHRTYMLKRTLSGLLAEITEIRQVLECDEID